MKPLGLSGQVSGTHEQRGQEGQCSPGSQPPTKYRTGKKSKYRRYLVFSGPNIGGFEENIMRFADFEGQS